MESQTNCIRFSENQQYLRTITVDDDKYPVFKTKHDLLACTQTVSGSPKMNNIYTLAPHDR